MNLDKTNEYIKNKANFKKLQSLSVLFLLDYWRLFMHGTHTLYRVNIPQSQYL